MREKNSLAKPLWNFSEDIWKYGNQFELSQKEGWAISRKFELIFI